MFTPLPLLIVIILFWVVVSAGIGWLVGFILAKLCGCKNRWLANIIIGVTGCFSGRYLGGWAWMKADNTGDPEAFLIWDRYGQLKIWRTALADSQDILGISAAIAFVIIWNLLFLILRGRQPRTAQQALAADRS